MPSPQEKLAQSLELLRKKQQEDGSAAIRSRDLPRTHRERLLRNGFIKEVMKGWYIPSKVDETQGESTAWYSSFWQFCSAYMNERFGGNWSLSPEQSLTIHAENWTVPPQLVVRAPKGNNNLTKLLHDTSILDVLTTIPSPEDTEVIDGLRLYSLEAALIAASPTYFKQSPTDARSALSKIKDASTLLEHLLDGGHSVVAGRLAGAFRNIGKDRIADDIMSAMADAEFTVKLSDPFEKDTPILLASRIASPIAIRLRLLWKEMRKSVIENFAIPTNPPESIKAYLKEVEDNYITDAYHSLSIEGYRVSPELIERVRSGDWNPDKNDEDRTHRDAMAARGYYLAFEAVKDSVEKVLNGENPGEVADKNHGTWYRQLFSPSVTAGFLKRSDLAGYRRGPVYIRHSRYVPMKHNNVSDAMATFFELLREENNQAVRVVLGHFFFVYIHPYMDGNGRIGRFLMNVMLASGGYPWTVIPVENRTRYMDALEEASIHQNIVPFSSFLAGLLSKGRT